MATEKTRLVLITPEWGGELQKGDRVSVYRVDADLAQRFEDALTDYGEIEDEGVLLLRATEDNGQLRIQKGE